MATIGFSKRRVSLWSHSLSDSSVSINCCRPGNSSRTLLPASDLKIAQYLESKRLGSLDVFFRDGEEVELGDVAHGWIELSLERPALLTSMSISFYGIASFEIFGQMQSRQFEMRKYELWKYEERDNVNVMEPGFYVYEFFVGTHTQLPVPFEGDGAVRSVTYYCEVTAVETFLDDQGSIPIDHIKRKVLRMKPNSNGSIRDRFPSEPITEKGLMYVRNIVDCSGTVVLTATLLDGRQYRPGENVRFQLEVLNCFRRLKIQVALVQKAKACVDDCLVGVELDVVRVRVGKLASGDMYKRFTNMAVWIPSPSIAPVHVGLVYANRLVRMGYCFTVTVTTWMGKKMVIEIPLIVRNCQTMTNEKNYATL